MRRLAFLFICCLTVVACDSKHLDSSRDSFLRTKFGTENISIHNNQTHYDFIVKDTSNNVWYVDFAFGKTNLATYQKVF